MSETVYQLTKVLSGHVSPETAYVVDDYPYGFRLRCKIRYWLEFKPKHGYRFMSQTTNPKIAGREVWNKPKAGTYHHLAAMYLDGIGHMNYAVLQGHGWATLEHCDAFEKVFGEALDDQGREILMATRRAAVQRLERQAVYQQQLRDRLFIAVRSTGLMYCDKSIQRNGDFLELAFLPYSTLQLEVREAGHGSCLLPLVNKDVEEMQAKRGQPFEISGSGQTVILGGA